MLQRSRESGTCFWFPRVAEPGTGCTDLEWVEASGRRHGVLDDRDPAEAADAAITTSR